MNPTPVSASAVSASSRRAPPTACGRRRLQRGQVLIYGIAILALGLGVLYFVYRAGALIEEKIRLVDASDAAAYTAAAMDARLLNFYSYTNRAMFADSVSIAQLVSLSSWLAYASRLNDVQSKVFAETGNTLKFPWFEPSLAAAALAQRASKRVAPLLNQLGKGLDREIHWELMNSQKEAHYALSLSRKLAMDHVVAAALGTRSGFHVTILSSSNRPDVGKFTHSYSRFLRWRFGSLVRAAVDSESFNTRRSWFMWGDYADCPTADTAGRHDFLIRLGGTQMLGLNEWRAVDTLSEHIWIPADPEDAECQLPFEIPAAFGMTDVASSPTKVDSDPLHYDATLLVNPLATLQTELVGPSKNETYKYKGIPSVYGLSPLQLLRSNPQLRVAVLVSATPASAPQGTLPEPWASLFSPYAANARMSAVSAAQVYYSAPKHSLVRMEAPSLYQPYWTARLVASPNAVHQAQAQQGAYLP